MKKYYYITIMIIFALCMADRAKAEDAVDAFKQAAQSGGNVAQFPSVIIDSLLQCPIAAHESGFVVYKKPDNSYAAPVVEGGGGSVDVWQYNYSEEYVESKYTGIMAHTHPPDENPSLYKGQIFSGGGGNMVSIGGGDMDIFLNGVKQKIWILKTKQGFYIIAKPTNWTKPNENRIESLLNQYSTSLRVISNQSPPDRRRQPEQTALKILARQLNLNLYFRDANSSGAFQLLVAATSAAN